LERTNGEVKELNAYIVKLKARKTAAANDKKAGIQTLIEAEEAKVTAFNNDITAFKKNQADKKKEREDADKARAVAAADEERARKNQEMQTK